jgi:hypothetical protein
MVLPFAQRFDQRDDVAPVAAQRTCAIVKLNAALASGGCHSAAGANLVSNGGVERAGRVSVAVDGDSYQCWEMTENRTVLLASTREGIRQVFTPERPLVTHDADGSAYGAKDGVEREVMCHDSPYFPQRPYSFRLMSCGRQLCSVRM